MITEDMRVAMQGIVPSALVTCSKEGTPNTTYISQVYYVDDNHVALSRQFFNKSVRNMIENPYACVSIISPDDANMWKFDIRFSHSEFEGELFELMSAQLEAIASMMGMESVFRLKSSDVFEILRVEKIT